MELLEEINVKGIFHEYIIEEKKNNHIINIEIE